MNWKIFAALAVLLPAHAFAQAQRPVQPSQPPSFSAAFTGLAIPQTAAMDAVCLIGAPNRFVRVQRVSVSGISSIAQTTTINLVKRSAASTGGTSANAPVVLMDTNTQTHPAAVLKGYTAASTPSAGAVIRSAAVGFGLAPTSGELQMLAWIFDPQQMALPPILIGPAEQLCINIPAALAGGVALNADFSWTEQ